MVEMVNGIGKFMWMTNGIDIPLILSLKGGRIWSICYFFRLDSVYRRDIRFMMIIMRTTNGIDHLIRIPDSLICIAYNFNLL